MKKLIARLFGRAPKDLVPFLDIATRKVSMIPKAELSPGAVLIQIQGQPSPVYADSAQLKQGAYRHPPFEGELREAVQSITDDLAEVCGMSFAQWEDGFRRDMNPDREMAGWLHLAAILNTLTAKFGFDAAQKKECYRVLVACYTGERATVRERSDPQVLTDDQVDLAIRYFFEGGYR